MNVPHALIAAPIPHFLVSCCMSPEEEESHQLMNDVLAPNYPQSSEDIQLIYIYIA